MIKEIINAFVDESCQKYGIGNDIFYIQPSQIVGSSFLTAIYRERCLNYPKFHKMDDLSKACFLAAELAVSAVAESLDKKGTGVVFFNREGSLVSDFNFKKTISDTENFFPSPSVFVYTLPNILTGEICIRHGFQGESSFYVLDSNDTEIIHNVVNDMLQNNNAVVCGWSELIENKIRSEVKVFISNN